MDSSYLVNLDNDNVVTTQWLTDSVRAALETLPRAMRKPSFPLGYGDVVATHWLSKQPGTFGRIGLSLNAFLAVGGYGYDERFEAIDRGECKKSWSS